MTAENFFIALEEVFKSSPFLGLGASFLAGIFFSFSPCVYPLIPITLAVVGAVSASTKLKGFLVSLIFVLGVSAIYTFLGVISSVFGVLIGTFYINPFTYFILAAVFFFLSALEFGIFKFNLPLSINYSPDSKKGLLSVFVLGMISGFAMIPCNFPVLGGILTLIALKGNVFYGAVALFIFSLGYGLILLILGTFASLVKKVPKQGKWGVVIKKSFGVGFAAIGVYFLVRFFSLM